MAELSIDVTEQGDGERPKVGDTVMMHYILWANQGVTSSEYDYDKEEYVDEICYSTYDESIPLSASSFHTFHGYRTPPYQSIRCNIEVVSIIEEA